MGMVIEDLIKDLSFAQNVIDNYDQQLKADEIAMLEDLLMEIKHTVTIDKCVSSNEELVKRNDVMKVIQSRIDKLKTKEFAYKPMNIDRSSGEWISLGDNNYECSECHEKCYFPKLCIANYCFFCGAKMVKLQESEE